MGKWGWLADQRHAEQFDPAGDQLHGLRQHELRRGHLRRHSWLGGSPRRDDDGREIQFAFWNGIRHPEQWISGGRPKKQCAASRANRAAAAAGTYTTDWLGTVC